MAFRWVILVWTIALLAADPAWALSAAPAPDEPLNRVLDYLDAAIGLCDRTAYPAVADEAQRLLQQEADNLATRWPQLSGLDPQAMADRIAADSALQSQPEAQAFADWVAQVHNRLYLQSFGLMQCGSFNEDALLPNPESLALAQTQLETDIDSRRRQAESAMAQCDAAAYQLALLDLRNTPTLNAFKQWAWTVSWLAYTRHDEAPYRTLQTVRHRLQFDEATLQQQWQARRCEVTPIALISELTWQPIPQTPQQCEAPSSPLDLLSEHPSGQPCKVHMQSAASQVTLWNTQTPTCQAQLYQLQQALDTYFTTHWTPPEQLPTAGTLLVAYTLSPDGIIQSVTLEQSTLDPATTQSLLTLLQSQSPTYPPLPACTQITPLLHQFHLSPGP